MPGESLQAKLRDIAGEQVKGITDKFAAAGIGIWTEEAPNGAGVSFMCHDQQILVRADHLVPVQRVLGQAENFDKVEKVIPGVVVLTVDLTDFKREQPKYTVLNALATVDQTLGEGIATPNHVLTVCDGIVSPCPATEPAEVEFESNPYPDVRRDNSGEGVLIYIADTGLLEGADTAHSWLQGVKPAPDDGWDPNPPDPITGVIPPYGGHGTFVAGVVRCMAPRAEVYVSNICKIAGSTLESDLVTDLTQALRLGVDIFHLSIAAPTRNDLPLLAFERWLALLDQYKGTVCVVAAGNSGVRWPTWPSVFPQTVSVGALDKHWRDRAEFSNYGGWVDVYAPGQDIVNAYAEGKYVYQNKPKKGDPDGKFDGMAMWSGTSFSTPIVTGLIAARMSRTGENGKDAAAALLREARSNAIPGVGAILLPSEGEQR